MSWKISVVGEVVRNLSEKMESLWTLWGMGPFEIRQYDDYVSAKVQTEKLKFELVQPLSCDGVYASFLREHGEGLHHIGISFADQEEEKRFRKSIEEKGIQPVDLSERSIFETWGQLGFCLEIQHSTQLKDISYYPGETEIPDFPVRQYIRQMGILVPDTSEAIRNYQYYLGLDGWTTVSFHDGNLSDFLINGMPYFGHYEFICSVKWVGEVEFELVEPVSGPLIYFDYMKRKGPGLHHIKTVMSDYEIQRLEKHLHKYGICDIQSGRMDDNHHYNMNTEKVFGFTFELGNGGKSIATR